MVTGIAEAARQVGVSRQTLHRWRNNGLLGAPYLLPDGRIDLTPEGRPSLSEFCLVMKQQQFRL